MSQDTGQLAVEDASVADGQLWTNLAAELRAVAAVAEQDDSADSRAATVRMAALTAYAMGLLEGKSEVPLGSYYATISGDGQGQAAERDPVEQLAELLESLGNDATVRIIPLLVILAFGAGVGVGAVAVKYLDAAEEQARADQG
jgi:hypothetical protein